MQRVSSHDMHTNGMPDMKRLSLNRNAPQRPGANANYAGVLIVWDRLFGSFTPEGLPV